ncbi:MAG: putative baseplate assembly protein, partial [Planctomycetota bacterium]
MKAHLSSLAWDGESPLRRLTTRQASDPAIALMDAWATVADVLTFYQERIANEGYLRTAVERRSILELARLIGYKLRPGVAASVHLAFSMEEGSGETVIPKGTAAKSIPGPGELPQTFETSEPLKARPEWNELKPRLTRPQKITANTETIYIKGTASNLKPNDLLLIDLRKEGQRAIPRLVESVNVDHDKRHTIVR